MSVNWWREKKNPTIMYSLYAQAQALFFLSEWFMRTLTVIDTEELRKCLIELCHRSPAAQKEACHVACTCI